MATACERGTVPPFSPAIASGLRAGGGPTIKATQQRRARMLRSTIGLSTLAAALAFATLTGAAQAQTKITVGKITSGSGFHIPSYVAMDQGFYKAEGLDASFITLPGRALVTAGLTGSIDFIPIPSGGSQAALSGAEIRYVVGESLKSQWLIISRPNIATPEDLRGKTLAYGRA